MPTHTHPSRAHQVPRDTSKRKKKAKPAHLGGRPRPKAHKVNPTKRRIRDLERLLARTEKPMPADMRVEKERELAGLKKELQVEKGEIRRAEMIGRYHMVRFFDSKKAERALKRARRAEKEAEGKDRREAQERVHRCEVDWNYTRFYPFLKAYHALYPPKQKGGDKEEEEMDVDGEQAENAERGDRKIWKQVEQAMTDGTLEALRDSLPDDGQESKEDVKTREDFKRKKGSKYATVVTHKKESEKQNDGEDSDDSDGGFFE